MAPHIRSGLSTLPPELTSCILANDPSFLPALLGLAVSGDDPRGWAAENNFNPGEAYNFLTIPKTLRVPSARITLS